MVENTAVLNFIFLETLVLLVTANIICILLKVPAAKRIYVWTLLFAKIGIVNVVCLRQGFVTGIEKMILISELTAFLFVGCQMVFLEMPFLEVTVAAVLSELAAIGLVLAPLTVINYIRYGVTGIKEDKPLGWHSIIVAAVVLLLTYFTMRFLEKNRWNLVDRELRPRIFWTVIAGGYIAYSVLGMQPKEQTLKPTVGQLIPVVIGFLILYEISWSIRKNSQKRMQKEYETLMLENTVMKEYYTSLEDQVQRTRKLNHDIGNHMTVLRELYERVHWDDKGQEYIDELEAEFQKSILTVFCDDPVINAVLTNKRKQCMEHEIPIHIEVKAFQMGNIKEMDMVALFVNLLDNALEECLRLPKDVRKIEVFCDKRERNMFLLVRNSTGKKDMSYDAVANKEFGKGKISALLKTSKKNAAVHGVGLQIIKDIIDRQDGNLEMSVQGGMFEAIVQWNARDK